MGILEKLTTRNIIALSVTGTVLSSIGVFLYDPERLIVTIKENQEFVIGGSVIFGVLLSKWADIVQFFFRKPQSKESQRDP